MHWAYSVKIIFFVLFAWRYISILYFIYDDKQNTACYEIKNKKLKVLLTIRRLINYILGYFF